MKYYDFLVDLGCFSPIDLKPIIKNKRTIETLLARYTKKGYIKRIRKNYYATMDIINLSPVSNKYLIATQLNPLHYIAYHSALEYYGYQNQVFNEIVYCGEKRINDFEFEHIKYHYVKSKCNLQIEKKYDGVYVTSLERTIIDCIDQLDLAGGIEELYHTLDSIQNINENKLVEILNYYNKAILYQRSGYILDSFKDQLHISDMTLEYLQSKIGKSKCYLTSSKKITNVKYDKKWNICIPSYIPTILTKGTMDYAI